MYFLQAFQSPIAVRQGDKTYIVPKLLIDDILEWSSEIMTERSAELTQGMEDSRRREYLAFYPPVAPDLSEMRRHVRTPVGINRVIRTCFMRAKVKDASGNQLPKPTPDDVQTIISQNGIGRLSGLALALADLEDNSTVNPDDKKGKDGDDPLKVSGKTASEPSQETGLET